MTAKVELAGFLDSLILSLPVTSCLKMNLVVVR